MIMTVGLVKGLNEVCKALDRKEALLAVLAEDCEDAKYKKLITVSCLPLIPIATVQDQQHSLDRGGEEVRLGRVARTMQIRQDRSRQKSQRSLFRSHQGLRRGDRCPRLRTQPPQGELR